MTPSELADWWDGQKAITEEILLEWVEENPQWWTVVVATAAQTSMELGAGLVDVLRLGEGLQQGGVTGVGKDALRALVVLGPVARSGGVLGRLVHTRSLRLAVATTGIEGPCTFTAVNNALTILAGKARNLFVTAADAAAALGTPLRSVPKGSSGLYQLAAWIDELVPFLLKQKVRLQALGTPKTIEDVIAAARANDGVVIFAIEWTDLAGQLRRHSMIAVRTVRGVKFADYGGKFINSLTDLAKRGGSWATSSGYRMVVEKGLDEQVLVPGLKWIGNLERFGRGVMHGGMLLLQGLRLIETPGRGVDFAFEVVPSAAIETSAHEPQVIQASFEAFKARKAGTPLAKLPRIGLTGRRNGPPPAVHLTGVQYRLNAAGFGAGPVDGVFGPRTQRAVRTFQQTYDLKCDGIPGPRTQRRLSEVCGI